MVNDRRSWAPVRRTATAVAAPISPAARTRVWSAGWPPRRKFVDTSDSYPPHEAVRAAERAARGLSRRIKARLIIAVFLLVGAANMWMWWAGSWPGSLDSGMNVFAGVAQVSGIMAQYVILVQILLVARIPLLERNLGAEFLIRAHSVLGVSVMVFLVEHIVGAVVLNMRLPGESAVGGVVAVLLLQDVAAATVGTAILAVIVVVSGQKIRRRLSYERWRLIHVFAYLAVALVFLHELSLGVHFIASDVARAYWVLLHLVVLTCVLWWRVGAIVLMNLRTRLEVERLESETANVHTIYLTGRHLDRLNALPGQYFRFRFLTWDGWWQSHPFSLSSAATAGNLRITVKELGDWTTNHTKRLRPGIPVFLSGPYGGLTLHRRTRHLVVLIAAGVGITPLRSLLAALPPAPSREGLYLLYRARSRKDLVFRKELERLTAERGGRVHYLLGESRSFLDRQPFGPRQLTRLVPSIMYADVYLCGPEPMLVSAIDGLRKAGVPRAHIHTERFML